MRDRLEYSDQIYNAPTSWRPSVMGHKSDWWTDQLVRHLAGPLLSMLRPFIKPFKWAWDRGLWGGMVLLGVLVVIVGIFLAVVGVFLA